MGWDESRGPPLHVSQSNFDPLLVGAAHYHHFQVHLSAEMATQVSSVYEASSKLAKYPFEPYWPSKLKICVTGAGGFIASYVIV